MFYLLKNLLLLIIVIFKLKCNNLIFNEIMVLNASYVCLHAFSLRRESPDPDLEYGPLISEGVLSQVAILSAMRCCTTVAASVASSLASSSPVIGRVGAVEIGDPK
jgi:hypothetical protein